MQTIILTSTFERRAARAGLSDEEVQGIASVIASDPMAGDLIKETGGLRKIRFARRGQGKSGGFRTIHYFAGDDVPVFLLDLIDKHEKANLSKAERNMLAKALPALAESYRSRRSKGV